MLSVICDHNHAVTLEEMEAGVVAGQGTYRAVCGHPVLVCAMATPPGPRCRSCEDELLTAPPPKQRWWTAALRFVLGRIHHSATRASEVERRCM